MIAAAATSSATWRFLGAVAIFLLAVVALAADRTRVKRRLARVERAGALLETDLADARREIDALRDCLRAASRQPQVAPGDGPGTSGPPTAVV